MSEISPDPQSIAFPHNSRYRERYRALLSNLVFLAVLSVTLLLTLLGVILTKGQPRYYATTTTGNVVPLYPLSEPMISDQYLLEWAALALRSAYNLDFNNYQQELQSSAGNFTKAGWQQFNLALNQQGLLQTIINQKLIMSAVVAGTPVVLNKQVLNGAYTWSMQLPVLVTFSSASTQKQSRLIVDMLIQRVADLTVPQGIQISNFTASQDVFNAQQSQ